MKQNKKAQEEMVGFALIIVIVAVILLIFLGFSLNSKKEAVENYEVESFIQSFLQYTSDCEDYLDYLSLQDLIFACERNKKCLDGRDSCEVLNETLTGIAEAGFPIEGDRPVKGYFLNITIEGGEMFSLTKGNITKNSKGAIQDFSKSGQFFEISFKTYY